MTPTICSGKKRQTRSDMRHNVRRPHLKLALSDVVNYDCQRTGNQRVSGSLNHPWKHNQQNTNGTSVSSPTTPSVIKEHNFRQLMVDISDNAVTSSSTYYDGTDGPSDAPSSFEPKLNSRCFENESSYHSNSNSDSSTSARIGTMDCSQYSFGHDDLYDAFVSAEEDDIEQSRTTATYETDCETDSMTSLDTEKSAKMKRDNHPLWRDKLLAKHGHNVKKPLSNICNQKTVGLLSIAIKTIKLVKRNNRLQQRLTQLQLETSEFIQSVLSNEENRHFRTSIQREVENIHQTRT